MFLCILCALPDIIQANQPIHHEIHVILNPAQHSLKIEDTITFPEHILSEVKGQLDFLLHEGLQVSTPTRAVTLDPTARTTHYDSTGHLYLEYLFRYTDHRSSI